MGLESQLFWLQLIRKPDRDWNMFFGPDGEGDGAGLQLIRKPDRDWNLQQAKALLEKYGGLQLIRKPDRDWNLSIQEEIR